MHSFAESLAQAKALTLQGRLVEATRLIQTGLGIERFAPPDATPKNAEARSNVYFNTPPIPNPPSSSTRPAPVWHAYKANAVDIDFREGADVAMPPTAITPPVADSPASFTFHAIQSGSQSYHYRLFVPSRSVAAPALPIVVMLHGCKQNAEDFARGTAMNAIAEREKFIVVYPEQMRHANTMGCWNWFEPQHQQRGQGEPAMIAALVAKLVAGHVGDASRVYIAGLSAGGAMAALVGQLYPDVFAAVGVHSGLAPAAAHNVVSALSAMRQGPGAGALRPVTLPLIVFQGAGDTTVVPANAQALVKTELQALAARDTVLQKSSEEANPDAGRKATRERWIDTNGKCRVESWNVVAGPHAWAGGDATGSFTDPQGPSASEAMFSFFRLHSKASMASKSI